MCIRDREVASTSAQHKKGLMYRKNLPHNKGMFFIFKKAQPLSFWMKNTLIPLDIIYLSSDKKVVCLIKNAQPCKENPCRSYSCSQPAKYVLEINGGLSDKLGIEVGIKSEFNLL